MSLRLVIHNSIMMCFFCFNLVTFPLFCLFLDSKLPLSASCSLIIYSSEKTGRSYPANRRSKWLELIAPCSYILSSLSNGFLRPVFPALCIFYMRHIFSYIFFTTLIFHTYKTHFQFSILYEAVH